MHQEAQKKVANIAKTVDDLKKAASSPAVLDSLVVSAEKEAAAAKLAADAAAKALKSAQETNVPKDKLSLLEKSKKDASDKLVTSLNAAAELKKVQSRPALSALVDAASKKASEAAKAAADSLKSLKKVQNGVSASTLGIKFFSICGNFRNHRESKE